MILLNLPVVKNMAPVIRHSAKVAQALYAPRNGMSNSRIVRLVPIISSKRSPEIHKSTSFGS